MQHPRRGYVLKIRIEATRRERGAIQGLGRILDTGAVARRRALEQRGRIVGRAFGRESVDRGDEGVGGEVVESSPQGVESALPVVGRLHPTIITDASDLASARIDSDALCAEGGTLHRQGDHTRRPHAFTPRTGRAR